MAKSSPVMKKLALEPLKVTCTSSDCNNNLHCFSATKEMVKSDAVGACRSCGAKLVDWERVHDKDLTDARYTFDALKFEMIRHHFWHVTIDPKAVNYARRKGLSGLRSAVRARLRTSIGPANNPYDGRQTPMEGSGNPIHYAQHATASCCRKCVEYWHAIPKGRTLTDDEIDYLAELAMRFIEERIPNLTQNGEHVPPIRRPTSD
jgi:hypothetical protein